MFRVLLVDDEAFFRQGLRELIGWEKCGFVVSGESDNGEDALEMILVDTPDVVITDIRMPVLDGLGLIRRAVLEHHLQTKFIIVSGYDEFKYAQQALKYGVCDFLLKPIDETVMEATLLELKGKLENEAAEAMRQQSRLGSEVIAALIKGEFTSEQAEEWQTMMELPSRGDYYYLFIEPNENDPQLMEARTDALQDMRQLTLAAMEAIAPTMRTLHTHEHRGRLGVLVAEAALPEHWSLERLAKSLQGKLQAAAGRPICVYAGGAVSRLADLKLAYESAKEAMQYKYMDESRSVFLYNELRAIQPHYMIMDNSFFHRLNECMEENDEPAIAEAVDQIFLQFRTRCFVPEAVRTSLHRCVSEALATLHRMDIDTEAMVYKKPMLSWYDRNVTGTALKELFARFVMECSKHAARQRKDLAKGGVQKVKSYIDANYASNINLKSIAARFFMNPVYLGQLFKKTYGTYFNDYVLQLRVNEAKRLLRQTDHRIYEIADRIGFNNVEYFVSQFEKLENMTPTEYRNSLR
ncbi:response regulator transcription factor [Paenibacillus sp. LHD-117]|uniref:response regulator transcription factor n=1 Tax=Paenibacillus sp. LHD-117 TaxID=3071412 RepID=UPI0027E13E8C|nr:response regulator transcription factor [Paenibacillus sp. LHD-117]MDQ6419165.1 response regulator transcription factor [Paenibacillus sp. LHD-117]